MKGSCLCGSVVFDVSVKPVKFYRCHCSLCRKQSGVGFNLATLVKADSFSWVKGRGDIASWSRPSGYRNDFCSHCASTVPNMLRGLPYFWVPVGLLDEPIEMQCAGDYFTDDAMPWDKARSDSNHGGPVESLKSLIKVLGTLD